MSLTDDQQLELYYFLRLTRAVEDQLHRLNLQGRVVGSLYFSSGEEAVSVGSAYALTKDDVLMPLHRNMGSFLAKRMPLEAIFAQYFGRVTGPTKGKDAYSHMGDRDRNIIAGVSELGTSVPVSAGAALAFRMRNEPRVALTYVGDGGMSTGDVHEGINFAAVLDLPLIVVIENNGWAFGTPVERNAKVANLADRAIGYGIPGVTIDGNDVVEVYEATKTAVDRARSGGGASIIECKTFRMAGHSVHDDARYVPKHQFEAWQDRNPIVIQERRLTDQGLLTEAKRGEIEARIRSEIAAAVRVAEAGPMPTPAELLTDVFADTLPISYLEEEVVRR